MIISSRSSHIHVQSVRIREAGDLMEIDRFLQTMIIDFCIAFGFLVGGCLLGGLGAFIVGDPPTRLMVDLADKLKIWAVVASIGGTFDAISTIERGFFYG
jgi:hypothetical protein